MIEELTGNETAEELTNDLRERIKTNTPYPDYIGQVLIPFEPIIIAKELIEPYINHRVIEQDGKFILPIATYVDGCRTSYTLFDECVDWSNAYGIDCIYVDKMSNYGNIE